ncbi:MAG: hypothetical protein FWD21_01345 [Peptococcaceae bacterium]|nr:hypothetical protein [Peptococcaceae bacterium]
MSTTVMSGPYSLNNATIDEKVTRKWPGIYALITAWSGGVKYIGRSDVDVNGSLKEHIGVYSEFKFIYADTAKDSFNEECRIFHSFPSSYRLDNKKHPERPENSDWKCPICKIYE